MLGRTLGHYRLIELIGAGGMGVVYLAHDERLNRDIVIKVLPAQADSDSVARDQLIREAQTASALNHPYICTIHEVGEEAGRVFIAMEYVRGQTLAALVSHAPIRAREVLRYGSQVAEALEHAHGKGIIHRDLKTSNVIVTPEERVKVLDFGLAKRLRTDEAESTFSQPLISEGRIAGTLSYMAPEVLQGTLADERADIWALGVMLYEMCAGRHPFHGGSPYEITSAILRDDPAPLPAVLPAGLTAVINRCLTKERNRRYQRAGEVRAALEGIQAGEFVAGPKQQTRHSAVSLLIWTAVTMLAIAALVLGYKAFISRPPIRSVAVLPFSTTSVDTEYLSDGITDGLIDSISQLSQVKVISHASAFHYKGKEVEPRTVGHELGVDTVLIGRVRSHGDAVDVSVELVNTDDNTRMWGKQYTRKMSDVATVQREISQEIGEQFRVHVSTEQKVLLRKQSTEDSEAYLLYLRGLYYRNKETAQDSETARRYFEEAISKDPAFALAYFGLNAYYADLSDNGLASPQQVIPQARASILRALAIDPNLGPAHNSLGYIIMAFDWNLPEAEREFKRAMELSPNWEGTYRNYAIWLRANGRLDEAIESMKRARELNPLSVSINNTLGWTFYYGHRYPEAIKQFQTSVAMDPSSLYGQLGLASAYHENHMERESIQAWQTYIIASGSKELASEVGRIYKTSGYWTAMRVFQQAALDANTAAAHRSYISPMVFAGLHAVLRDNDEAFSWLDKAYEERSPRLLDLKLDPDFDSLRRDPRFSDLVRRIGLP